MPLGHQLSRAVLDANDAMHAVKNSPAVQTSLIISITTYSQ